MTPTPHKLDDELLRIYVGCLDDSNIGRVGYVDVRLDRPADVVRIATEPVLDIGSPGCFDDHGVVPTSVLQVGDELWLYYGGFQLAEHGRYKQFTGLAVSRDGGNSFERVSSAPILGPTASELIARTSAFVRRVGDHFQMYYSGGSSWIDRGGKALPVYNLRELTSQDGRSWGADGRVVLDFASDDEHVIGRAWPLPTRDGVQRMLLSVRSTSRDYRLGLAASEDGRTWDRRDHETGIDVSTEGWDARSMAYGSIVEHGGSAYLFYCGDQRGRAGFGYAELDSW
jgi:predicted GH43/DUF377 family glycosyl hydrolase